MSVDRPGNFKRPINQPSANPDTSGGDQSYLPGPIEQQPDRTRVQQTGVGASLITAGRQVGAAGISLKAKEEAERRRLEAKAEQRKELQDKIFLAKYRAEYSLKALELGRNSLNDVTMPARDIPRAFQSTLHTISGFSAEADPVRRQNMEVIESQVNASIIPTIYSQSDQLANQEIYAEADELQARLQDVAAANPTTAQFLQNEEAIKDMFTSIPRLHGGGSKEHTNIVRNFTQQMVYNALRSQLAPAEGFRTRDDIDRTINDVTAKLGDPEILRMLSGGDEVQLSEKLISMAESLKKAQVAEARSQITSMLASAAKAMVSTGDWGPLQAQFQQLSEFMTDDDRREFSMYQAYSGVFQKYRELIINGSPSEVAAFERSLDPRDSKNGIAVDSNFATHVSIYNALLEAGSDLKQKRADDITYGSPLQMADPEENLWANAALEVSSGKQTPNTIEPLTKDQVTSIMSDLRRLQQARDVNGLKTYWRDLQQQYDKPFSPGVSRFDIVVRQLGSFQGDPLADRSTATIALLTHLSPSTNKAWEDALTRAGTMSKADFEDYVPRARPGAKYTQVFEYYQRALLKHPATQALFGDVDKLIGPRRAHAVKQLEVLTNTLILNGLEGGTPQNPVRILDTEVPILSGMFGGNDATRAVDNLYSGYGQRVLQPQGMHYPAGSKFPTAHAAVHIVGVDPRPKNKPVKYGARFLPGSAVIVPDSAKSLTTDRDVKDGLTQLLNDPAYFRKKGLNVTGQVPVTRAVSYQPSKVLLSKDTLSQTFNEAGKDNDVNPFMLAALAQVQSSSNPELHRADRGTHGLFQFTTRRGQDLKITDLTNVPEVVNKTAAYIKALEKKYEGDQDRIIGALVAGEAAMDQEGKGASFEFGSVVDGATQGSLTSPFGMRKGKPHQGVDIAANVGQRVTSLLPGRVVRVDYGKGYGKYIDVDHGIIDGKRTITRYAHLSSHHVKAGMQIQAGAVVGLAGETGNARGPHLHFEIRQGGQPIDPTTFKMPGVVSPEIRNKVFAVKAQMSALAALNRQRVEPTQPSTRGAQGDADLEDYLRTGARKGVRIQQVGPDGVVLEVMTPTGLRRIQNEQGQAIKIPFSDIEHYLKQSRRPAGGAQ